MAVTEGGGGGGPGVLDEITCEGCGRKTYAQMASCPHCGREIDAAKSPLNLPPGYTRQDESGVRIYPHRGKRLAYNLVTFLTGCLLLVAGLFALRMQFSGRDLDPRGSAVSALGPPLGIVLIFQAIQMTWRLVYGLPVFYMGKKGIAFPHLNRRVLSWDNLKDIEAVETPRLFFFKKSSLTLEMHVPERIAFGSLNQLLSFGPRSTAFVPLLAGWPVPAEDLKDLILLGRETWIADGRPNVPSPTPEETEFNRVVKRAFVIAVVTALALPALLVALHLVG